MDYPKILKELFSSRPTATLPSNGASHTDEQNSKPQPLPAASETPFRPFAEPILKPRTDENRGGLHYPHVYQNAFQPKQKNESIHMGASSLHKDEHARVYAPNGDSVDSLLDAFCQSPANELDQLLPDGANKQEYLPAIQLAITCVTWKKRVALQWQALSEKFKTYWNKGKPGTKSPLSDWEEYVQRNTPVSTSSFDEPVGSNPFQPVYDESSIYKYTYNGLDSWALNGKYLNDLTSYYQALEATLTDYQRFGLLHYLPYMQAASSGAGGLHGWADQVIKVIASWAQLYDVFTRSPSGEGYLQENIEGDICRKYVSIHRDIQRLPACVLYKLPIFPNLREEYPSSQAYIEAVSAALKASTEYLSQILEEFLKTLPHKADRAFIDEVLSSLDRQISTSPAKGSLYRGHGDGKHYNLTPEDLLEMPDHLLSKQMNAETASEVFAQYLEEAEKTLAQLTEFSA